MSATEIPAAANNPLTKYFRVPGLHVRLPSGGRFFPEGGIEFTADNAVPVLPMRAADELLLKNPDALMSGFAIEKLLESCVPAIKFPRMISAPDLDVLLLAIRAATYGDEMEIQAVCPKCGHTNAFETHLPGIIETVKDCVEDATVRLTDELVLYLRPYSLDDTTMLSLATFEETRKVQALEMDETASAEKKTAQMNASMDRLAKLSSQLMANCITRIVTAEGEVTERKYIDEFFANINRQWSQKVEKLLNELNSAGIDKSVSVKCEKTKCEHEWTTTVEFDPSNFFASGSSD